MSYSTAYLIQRDGSLAELAEFRNSHGFGPFVWNAAAAKYLGSEFGWSSNSDKLWPLWKDMRLPRAWRIALLASYDYAIIERERFPEIASALRAFVLDVGVRDRACHWLAIADLLDANREGDARGMCFYGTSLSDNLWHPWDHEKDEAVPYNLDAPGKHFYVAAELDRSEQPHSTPSQPPADKEG